MTDLRSHRLCHPLRSVRSGWIHQSSVFFGTDSDDPKKLELDYNGRMMSDRHPSDLSRLLARVAKRDASALARLFDATSGWVYGLILRIVGDHAAADEVTLDVYLKVWRRAETYSNERGRVESWLAAIARRSAIDRLRSERPNRVAESAQTVSFDMLPSSDRGPEVESEESERRHQIADAVAQLTEPQRRTIELAYFLGLTHSEIAANLDWPLGTVKTHIRRGMVKLRDLLRPLETTL